MAAAWRAWLDEVNVKAQLAEVCTLMLTLQDVSLLLACVCALPAADCMCPSKRPWAADRVCMLGGELGGIACFAPNILCARQ